MNDSVFLKFTLLNIFLLFFGIAITKAQKVIFPRDFSPAEGLVTPQEKPYRDEVCLNGYWELQSVPVPSSWEGGTGVAPELPVPQEDKWEMVKIKIPSAINVNDWGRGGNVGEGTRNPYTPSSVYYPSYPDNWKHIRMGWLRKSFHVPVGWDGKRLLLHFEAVAGDCVVLVNGKEVCHNFDSHLPFDADISDYVNRDADNELLVGVRHTKLFDKSHSVYMKMGATYPTGSNTDDLIGIWQDVYLFGVPEVRITDVFVQPWVDKNELVLEIALINLSSKNKKITLNGVVKEWVNHAGKDVLTAPEINWSLGETALTVSSEPIILRAGESTTVTVHQKVDNCLKYWTPDTPNLYTLLLSLGDKKQAYDCKATRFGWRQFKIVGDEFQLNGKKIQCFGDIQHPFSAYICSRRFAYVWYEMIKDFGGNAVRPHAQPWPRVYYDLADEMGLMVLDETALFGSSIRLNFEEDLTWQRSYEHLKRLILRDRNHPSVIGWSAGNETFAIALLNKPTKEVAAIWDDKLVELTLSAKEFDSTRDFITLDGDRDMDGRLPVWSKHFSHGLKLEELPHNLNKPLIVGESGATYYGRPIQLYPFVGEKAFLSYEGRSEALAIDVYQNVKQMALPYLSYYSPSEVCWFGLEHMNLGYHDFKRLPNMTDGIFAGKPYEEGKPGYQYERVPPYVTTFNPGLDPQLPLYKPLPMFKALQAALKGGMWTPYKEVKHSAKPEMPLPLYRAAYMLGTVQLELLDFLTKVGVSLTDNPQKTNLWIIDAENVTAEDLRKVQPMLKKWQKKGGMLLALSSGSRLSDAFCKWLPENVRLTDRRASSLETNKNTTWGGYFELPDLYFGEMDGDRYIMKHGMAGGLIEKGNTVFSASRTDWTLFNNTPEHWKCAQVVLYEALKKPEGVALVTYAFGNVNMFLSVIDYRLWTEETSAFWKSLFKVMTIELDKADTQSGNTKKKEHDLLMDGPTD
jgi:beta-galactosidase